MNARTNRWVTAAASVALILGAVLSRVIEPGIRVEKVILTTDIPALRHFPAKPGPRPTVLLAHGNGASKEMMFCLGEALAAADFNCYSIDQAGYGESPQACSLTNLRSSMLEAQRALGAVDVFIGHSMGAENGSWSVRNAAFRPKLFIGVGFPAKVGEHGPPLLWLAGLFDEFFLGRAQLQAPTNAQVVISPWSDHALEVFDPLLVSAAVKAACATVDMPVPAAPTAWRWRLAGLVLGMAAAVVLMFCLPDLHPALAQMRRWIVPAVLLLALMLTMGKWFLDVTPQWRRIPQQLVISVFIWLTLGVFSRLGLPRWSLPVLTGILTLASVVALFGLPLAYAKSIYLSGVLMCTFVGSTLALLGGAAIGRISGSKRDGDVAMTIFAGYAIGQFMPVFY